MSARLVAAALGGSLLLAGCTTLGGNIKGSFACSAPDGICAPSALIDDRALAMISGTAEVVPAGPYTPAQEAIGGVRVAGGAGVGRTDQKVLKIVFPAHVDGRGRYHETSAIRAVVDNGAWLASAEPVDSKQVTLAQEPALAPPVDLASAVTQAPVAPAAQPPITREGLMAEVSQLLGKPAIPSSGSVPASAAASSAPAIAPAQGIVLPSSATSAAASAVAAPVNRPASFSGLVGE